MIPPFYRTIGPVSGLPLNWRHETSGVLPAAFNAYLDNRVNGTQINEAQLRLVCGFLRYFIDAPCWNCVDDDEHGAATLRQIRQDVHFLQTPDDICAWICRCLDLGIDPL